MSEPQPSQASLAEFARLDVRAGTVVRAEPFPEARKPAYRLWLDLGPELGVRKSSVQLTALYRVDELIGRQLLALVNLPPRQIGPFMSELLVLGLPDAEGRVVLVQPERPVPDGARLY
jgi:tRNA-binding protein